MQGGGSKCAARGTPGEINKFTWSTHPDASLPRTVSAPAFNPPSLSATHACFLATFANR